MAADVLVLNHTLFFTLLGGLDEEIEGGILFRNDFVIFDEAHTLESVASRHIGLSVSSGQLRYALHRLWNPRTEKGLLATLLAAGAFIIHPWLAIGVGLVALAQYYRMVKFMIPHGKLRKAIQDNLLESARWDGH